MSNGSFFCLTMVLLNAITMPAVLCAQPQLPPEPAFKSPEMPRFEPTEPLWLKGLRWLCTDGRWWVYGAAAAMGTFAIGSRQPARSAKPLLLIVGGLIVCAGLGLFLFGLLGQDHVLLPFGAVLVVFFGFVVVTLGLPRPSQGRGG